MDGLSPEPSLEAASPDDLSDAVAVQGWQLAGASVQGSAHLAVGLPCQDAHATLFMGNTLLLVVSDGAGSAQYAEAGSQAVCQGCLDWVQAQAEIPLADFDAEALLAFLQARLSELAEGLDTQPRELASTLLLALVRPAEALLVQIGDGGVVFAEPETELQLAFWPDEGEYAGSTSFVVSAGPEQLQILHLKSPLIRLALFSDGLQSLCLRYAEQRLHAPFFTPFFKALAETEHPSEFETRLALTLQGERISALSDDDKTLLLALRS